VCFHRLVDAGDRVGWAFGEAVRDIGACIAAKQRHDEVDLELGEFFQCVDDIEGWGSALQAANQVRFHERRR